ncbi:DUF934 domain-containing protein [Acidomonas methanolica]|uniref:DUF934 domain-containing protein n=1 Tax=Acidomonas methanolica TaxID=437 RepID=UPI00211A8491|nr:DUF934 domain-containing protein [Acidomonas methanolica]MCQ9154213.1 DUF934 domain-containing protein [Acidomonas methanolica]
MKRLELGGRSVAPPAATVEAVPFAELETTPGARGVVLSPEIDFPQIAPFLDRLDLVVVTFPLFRDGRGFTQARAVREYGKFGGEIRASGHVLPDQANYLRRCGVDAVMLPDEADEAPWRRELARFHTAYQPSVLDGPLGALRRKIG